MSVDRAAEAARERHHSGDVVMEGLITGMLGAVVVAGWFLVLDLMRGRPLYTPALLGTMLLHGGAAAIGPIVLAPLEIAAYTAFHFIAFMLVGLVLSWLMSLFDRFPIMFFVILVLFACLQLAFVAFSLALHFEAPDRLGLWSVVVANLLAAAAMGIFQARRHRAALRSVGQLWEHGE